jgi:HEPN domain-containing protein
LNNVTLAQSYLKKALVRLKTLELLIAEAAYSDVVREAQEAVELALKGILRQIGVEPPKQHDVGYLIIEYSELLPDEVAGQTGKLAEISRWLRKEREFAFYGDIDFIPTAEYSLSDAERALHDARIVVRAAQAVIPEPDNWR